MTTRDALIKCASTLGVPAADEGGTVPADHALATLALFGDFPVGAVSDHEQDLARGHLDTSLLFCSQIAADAGGVPLLYASLAPRACDSIVAALRTWIHRSRVQAQGDPLEAMAALERFKRCDDAQGGVLLEAADFDVPSPTPISDLTPGKSRVAMRAALKLYSTAPAELWCQDGDATLPALTRQAIGGTLPSEGAGWSDASRTCAVAALRAIHRRGATGASVGARLAAASDMLRSRSLTLCPARRGGVLERLLGEIPGNPLDPPVPGRMGSALPRLPWPQGRSRPA
jgi:hypothetical protein